MLKIMGYQAEVFFNKKGLKLSCYKNYADACKSILYHLESCDIFGIFMTLGYSKHQIIQQKVSGIFYPPLFRQFYDEFELLIQDNNLNIEKIGKLLRKYNKNSSVIEYITFTIHNVDINEEQIQTFYYKSIKDYEYELSYYENTIPQKLITSNHECEKINRELNKKFFISYDEEYTVDNQDDFDELFVLDDLY